MEVYVVMIGTAWEGCHSVGGVYKDRAEAEAHAREIDEGAGDSFAQVEVSWFD